MKGKWCLTLFAYFVQCTRFNGVVVLSQPWRIAFSSRTRSIISIHHSFQGRVRHVIILTLMIIKIRKKKITNNGHNVGLCLFHLDRDSNLTLSTMIHPSLILVRVFFFKNFKFLSSCGESFFF